MQRMFIILIICIFSIIVNAIGQTLFAPMQQSLSQLPNYAYFGNDKVILPSANTFDSLSELKDDYNNKGVLNSNLTSLIDKKIDPDQYVLGPGDALQIYIWGATEKKILLTLDAEGLIILPLIGPFDIGGKTLSDARRMLTEQILKTYKNSSCIIELTILRQFKIYVTGNIAKPGSYIANSLTRVSELIIAAGGITAKGKLRGVVVKNETFGDKEIDLISFFSNSDIEKNPYIQEGDQIFIPYKKQLITVNGAISHPGEYDFCDGDNLKSVIIVAGGFARDVDTSNIMLTRFLNNIDSLELIHLKFPKDSNFQILPDDRILFTPITDYRVFRQVYISGEINFPGVYPIRNDRSTLKGIINAAGGLTPNASLHTSKIIRKNPLLTGNREYERLKTYPVQMLSPVEAGYLKAKAKEEEGRISIDLEKILQSDSDASDVILRENDEIIIAKKDLSIKVSGAVVSPGLVSYISNKNANYFIQQAGGLLPNAKINSICVIKGGTNDFRPLKKVKDLQAGDVIIVPEKEYIDSMTFTKDILVIVGSVATILLSLFTVNNYINDK